MQEKSFYYTGNSMRGVFKASDLIFTKAVPFSEFQVGDIVVFLASEDAKMPVVHRVIKLTETSMLTHGDNNAKPDYPLSSNDTILLATHYIRDDKTIELTRGKSGMAEFKRNQRIHNLYAWRSRVGRFIGSLTPLRFFAPNIDKLKLDKFCRAGKPFKANLSYKGKFVAGYNFKENCWNVVGIWKFFYTSKMLSKIGLD